MYTQHVPQNSLSAKCVVAFLDFGSDAFVEKAIAEAPVLPNEITACTGYI